MAQLIGTGQGAYGVGDTEIRTTTPQNALGGLGKDAAGNEYRYVKAGAAIAANKAVTFTGSALGFDNVVATSATMQPLVGVVGATAFASGDYGWILRAGVGLVITTGSIAANVGLATSATSGGLATVAATDTGQGGAHVLVSSTSPQVCYINGV